MTEQDLKDGESVKGVAYTSGWEDFYRRMDKTKLRQPWSITRFDILSIIILSLGLIFVCLGAGWIAGLIK
jgi:hypothetical protein